MTRRRGFGALAVLAAVALGSVISPLASAAPGAPSGAGACRDDTGITVVVDMTAFGSGIDVRCAAQPVRSGFDALTKAGFTYAGTVRFPGLLCRIDGQPSSDPCQGAPPPDAYWAYWHADRGGAWTYSRAGAGRTPPAGSVEGWAFGDDAEPGVAPPPAAPAPTPTTTSPPAPAGPPGSVPEPGTPPGTSGTVTPPEPDPAVAAPGDEAKAPEGSSERGADGSSRAVAARPAIPSSPSRDESAGVGSPVGVLVTAAVLLGAAVLAGRRRRGQVGA